MLICIGLEPNVADEGIVVSQETSPLRYATNDDGAALLHIEQGTITTLNQTGAFIWEGLSHGDSPDAIVDRLAQEIGTDPTEIALDVHDFIEDLRRRKLMPR